MRVATLIMYSLVAFGFLIRMVQYIRAKKREERKKRTWDISQKTNTMATQKQTMHR